LTLKIPRVDGGPRRNTRRGSYFGIQMEKACE